jgi:uncharacterized protein
VKAWTFWKGGIALGLLSALSMVLLKPMGTSTVYPSTLAILLKPFFPEFVAGNAYFKTIPVSIGWEHLLVLGIPIGAYLAYRLAEGGRTSAQRAAAGKAVKPWVAFLGGFLVLFGARLAGGCTTGHVLSGMTQLSVSGFLFAAAMFAGGIPVALLLKRRLS